MNNADRPAFSTAAFGVMGDSIYEEGLTKREYFAAHCPDALVQFALDQAKSRTGFGVGMAIEIAARVAQQYADAALSQEDKAND